MEKIQGRQLQLGEVDVSVVDLNPKSRDDIPMVLRGLQHLYVNPETRERLFDLLDQHIRLNADHKIKGPAMGMWSILVLAALKEGVNVNFARLQTFANHHDNVRAMIGHSSPYDETFYEYESLVENVSLASPDLLRGVAQMIKKSGHSVARKLAWNRLARAQQLVGYRE